MLGDPQEGFAFGGMQNIVFDVHYLHRNRGQSVLRQSQCAEDRNHLLSACGIFSPLSDILALWSPHCHEFESVNFTDSIPEFPTS